MIKDYKIIKKLKETMANNFVHGPILYVMYDWEFTASIYYKN